MSTAGPYVMRISCGARENVHTKPTNTLWYKDFAYTGGIPTNGSGPTFICPPLTTLRYFPSSEGPENCYNIKRVPHGHYSMALHRYAFTALGHGDPAILAIEISPRVDIVKMAGGINSALVLNKTVAVNGRTLTITLHPTKGTSAIINAH
nr:putative leucine-rich repeat receptor-like serine/threonine-protein kinase At2g14440 [Ipomoea batatas]